MPPHPPPFEFRPQPPPAVTAGREPLKGTLHTAPWCKAKHFATAVGHSRAWRGPAHNVPLYTSTLCVSRSTVPNSCPQSIPPAQPLHCCYKHYRNHPQLLPNKLCHAESQLATTSSACCCGSHCAGVGGLCLLFLPAPSGCDLGRGVLATLRIQSRKKWTNAGEKSRASTGYVTCRHVVHSKQTT